MSAEQAVEGTEREVTQVLVIDRVELHVVDQVFDIGYLDDGDAAILEYETNACHDTVEIVYRHRHIAIRVTTVPKLAILVEPPSLGDSLRFER